VRTITRLNRFRRLLAERAKFEWVVDQAKDGYLIIKDGGEIQYANQQARLYLGLSENKNDTISETFHELIRKRYRCEPEAAWTIWPEQSDTCQKTPRYLVQSETATAKAFWLQVDTLQVNLPSESGVDLPLVIRLHDVTAQMTLQRDKWQFHAMVRHKFRTPLIPLLTGMDLLIKHAPGLSTAEIIKVTESAFEGIQRLHGEIEDILQYLDAPKLVCFGSGFHLSQLQPVVDEISTNLELEDVTIANEENLDIARIGLGISQNAFELILRELLENAKKFHPNQTPTVTMLVTRSKFREAITIRVADNGLTLSSEQLAQVWTPYYQGEKYFTGQASGMGLGLPMVASLVWSVGGTCHIYNRETGSGVVVELELPLEKFGDET
jgi:signal transduction histidine kinase